MMFFIFIKACKKYGFTYAINANNGLILALYPNDAFGFIEVKQEYYEQNYLKLFFKAIKKMRTYRKWGVQL